MDTHIDTRNPLHAKAYLRAAGHFLTGWPKDWSAEQLALALVDEESTEKDKIHLWQPAERQALSEGDDPYLYTDELITCLAEDMIDLLEENR